jgi:hypothetical protein
MRLPRVRFTVRRLMVAVAIVALTIAAIQMGQRRSFCREQAERWDTNAEVLRIQAGAILTNSLSPLEEIEREVDLLNRHRERAERQRHRFARAASYPWLPIPEDLPSP